MDLTANHCLGKGGTATAKVSGLAGGNWHIRGSGDQTDTASATTGTEVTLLVEDYKAAGAKYLAIVAAGNKAVNKLNSLIDADASLSKVRKQAAVLSHAYTQQAKNFRAYKGWPREVAPVIAELAKACVQMLTTFTCGPKRAASTNGTSRPTPPTLPPVLATPPQPAPATCSACLSGTCTLKPLAAGVHTLQRPIPECL